MNSKSNQSRSNSNRQSSRQHAIAPILEMAGRWGNLLTSQKFTELDEMTRLAPGTGSIGGGNSKVQELLKLGVQKGKVYASPDGSAFISMESGGKVVGCAYVQVSGKFITEARISVF